MSLFRTDNVDCPSCGKPVEFNVNYSVNADRRPDFRDAILDGSFQRETCPHCEHLFRLEPEMTYFDVARNQWILVKPASGLAEWQSLEEQARYTFEEAYGPEAPAAAQEIGANLRPRVTFGWTALREKILCAEEQLDDVKLELFKVGLLRNLDDQPVGDDVELRLLSVEESELVLGWIKPDGDILVETINVPREIYDSLPDSAAEWQPLREQLAAGPFVDIHRLLVESAMSDHVH